MSKIHKNSLLILSFGTLLIAVCLFFLKNEDRNLINTTGIVGSIASIVGLLITYVNIRYLMDTSEKVKKNIDETLNKLKQTNKLANIVKAITLIKEIENSIFNKQYEYALYRQKDVRDLISVITFQDVSLNQEFVKLKKIFNIDLSELIDFSFDKNSSEIEYNVIVKNLQNLNEFLLKIENELKFNSNEYNSNTESN